MDLRAAVEKEVVLLPGAREAIPTGFAIALPPGYEGQVRGRSGLAREYGVTLPNAPGTIDPDFRGEIHVILQNTGERAFVIERGARIAQLVIAPFVQPEWELVPSSDDLGPTTRGAGGFGHTGH